MEQHIVQPFHGFLTALDALQLKQALGRLVAQQQGGKGADAHFQVVLGGCVGQRTAAVREPDAEGAVVPGQKRVLDLQLDAQLAAVRVAGVILQKAGHVHDAAHGVGADGLLDVAVVHLKGNGLAEVGVAVHLVDHGVVGVDVLPQALLRLAVQVDHFLDVHDVVLDQVHHVAAGLVLYIIIDGHIGVVLIPAPVFLPCQRVAEQTAVGDGCKVGVQLVELGVVPVHPPHIAGGRNFGGDLPVLDVVGDFVGDDLPTQVVVQRDGVGVMQGEALALLVHLGQALDHQPLHDAVAGVLRVGAHTGDEADVVHRVVDVHLQRVDRELGDKVLAVKAAQHVGALQHGELGLLDLVVLPAGGGQLLLGHLKGVPQQGVILIEIIGLKIAVCIIFGGIHGWTSSLFW